MAALLTSLRRNWKRKGNVPNTMRSKPKSFLIAALLATTCLWAQAPVQPGQLAPESERIIRERVDVVVAPTTVLDKQGQYVTGLKASEFRLWDNERPQSIRVDEAVQPISLVVAIQANAKVEGVLPDIRKIGPMLSQLVAGENGEIAVVSFDHRIQLLQDFTTDPVKVKEALQQLRPGSSSSRLIDASIEASRMLKSRDRDHRRVLMLITETRDIASQGKMREALTDLEMANVIVFAVDISHLFAEFSSKVPAPRPDAIPASARPPIAGVAPTPTQTAQVLGLQGQNMQLLPVLTEIFRATRGIFVDNPVEVFTKYTGGRETGFMNMRDLERAVEAVGREIHNQYIVSYNPDNKEEGGYHSIRVEVTRPGLEVRTRGGYWMAGVLK
jgi:VWFA-related protein